jgi:hypothetical protein
MVTIHVDMLCYVVVHNDKLPTVLFPVDMATVTNILNGVTAPPPTNLTFLLANYVNHT